MTVFNRASTDLMFERKKKKKIKLRLRLCAKGQQVQEVPYFRIFFYIRLALQINKTLKIAATEGKKNKTTTT